MITHTNNFASDATRLSSYSSSLSSEWKDRTHTVFHNHYILSIESKMVDASIKMHLSAEKILRIEGELAAILNELK